MEKKIMKIYVLAINQAKSNIKISNRYSIELHSTKLDRHSRVLNKNLFNQIEIRDF